MMLFLKLNDVVLKFLQTLTLSGYMFVAGRVKVFNKSGFLSYKPVLIKAAKNSQDWINKHFHASFLYKVTISYCIPKDSIPKEGKELCIMALLKDGELSFKAIRCSSKSTFVCEQKA